MMIISMPLDGLIKFGRRESLLGPEMVFQGATFSETNTVGRIFVLNTENFQ